MTDDEFLDVCKKVQQREVGGHPILPYFRKDDGTVDRKKTLDWMQSMGIDIEELRQFDVPT